MRTPFGFCISLQQGVVDKFALKYLFIKWISDLLKWFEGHS